MKHLMNNFCYILAAFSLLFFNFETTAQDFEFQQKIFADDPGANDHFGSHSQGVDIDGDFALVAAHYWQAGDDDVCDYNYGSAYLFQFNHENCLWEFVNQIFAEDGAGGDEHPADLFGSAVSISGNTLAIGAEGYSPGECPTSNTGRVYIYTFDEITGVVSFQQVIDAQYYDPTLMSVELDGESEAFFGKTLDLEGDVLIVGAPSENQDEDGLSPMNSAGAVYVYRKNLAGIFIFEQKVVAQDRNTEDEFGYSVALFGDKFVVGAPYEEDPGPNVDAGSAYVYKNVAGGWSMIHKLVSPVRSFEDSFGTVVDLNQGWVVVGEPFDDHVDVGTPTDDDNGGTVQVYKYNGVDYNHFQELNAFDRIASNNQDQFGLDVSLDGTNLIVAAKGNRLDATGGGTAKSEAGGVYLFRFMDLDGIPPIDEYWFNTNKFVADTDGDPLTDERTVGDQFGTGIRIKEDQIIIAASFDDDFYTNAGAVYIYKSPVNPILNEIVSNQGGLCEGNPITLTVDGVLYDAAEWEWHEGSCEGPIIDTGVEIIVDPEETTTYCARATGCFDYVEEEHCKCIEVEKRDGYWHQTTLAGYKEHGNDITTDIDGNVYVTGFFEDNVVFDGGDNSNVIIPGTPSGSSRKAFVLKYDNCANLMWVVVADGSGASEGHAITMRETSTTLYIAGEYSNNFIMYNGVGDYGIGSGSISLSNPGTHGFVAHIDKEDGELYFVERVGSVGSYAKATALTIDESGSNIYVGGETFHSIGNTKIFIQRYVPTGFSLGSPVWHETSSNFYKAHLKALDFDEDSPEAGTDGALWAIGDFQGYFEINPGTGPTLSVSSALTDRDAFVLKFFDDGSYPNYFPSLSLLRKGNISETAGHFMEGNDIAIDPATGYAYLTGTKVGQCIGPDFAFNVPSSELDFALGNQTGYFVAMKADGSDLWGKAEITYPILVATGSSTGVCVKENRVYFVGERLEGIAFIGADIPGSSLDYDGLGGQHIYVVCYGADLGDYKWSNGTKNEGITGAVLADHFTGRICTDQLGHAFITGQFQGEMGMIDGDPVYPNPLLPYYYYTSNGGSLYTMRVDIDDVVDPGAFESPEIEDELVGLNVDFVKVEKQLEEDKNNSEEVKRTEPFDFNLVPNPANQKVKIVLLNRESVNSMQVDLFSVDGKLLLTRANYQSNQELDLSTFENGVYLVSVRSGLLNTTKKLILLH
jgi:hypothetical protein